MSTQGHESEAINVSGLKASLKKGGNIGIYNEAICSTAGGTAAKVTNTTPPSFTLTAGAKILVKFTYAISAENATLQVGSNTAKPIYYKGSALPADIVKAGSSLLLAYDGTNFNVVGDINIDSQYTLPTASDQTLGGVKVGTNLSIDQDGVLSATDTTYSAGDGINISNGEISVDATVALKTDLAPAKLGSGIGTCSTSSGTALEVVLSDYNLVQNGIVAVTFENDVPANATLNINSKGAKPIYYKGSAIEADVIKADDTVMFAYDGTNYVVTSLGGGGAVPVNPNETVNISLTQIGGNSADLIGASITITDDDSGDTLLDTTWTGNIITTEIDTNTHYTISVGTITGYLSCSDKSYQAGYQTEKNITFQFRAFGVFIEATDNTLYTSSTWASSGKTVNSIVLITNSCQIRISPQGSKAGGGFANQETIPLESYMSAKAENEARVWMDGEGDTARIKSCATASGITNSIAYTATNYTFPDGETKGFIPSLGQYLAIYANKTAISACLSTLSLTYKSRNYYSTTFQGVSTSNNWRYVWMLDWSNGNVSSDYISRSWEYIIVGSYE